MDRAKVNGVELECEVTGRGEPLLLISPVLSEGFKTLVSRPELNERHRIIFYRRRGWGGSTHTEAPVSIADHARDAAALLEWLGIERAHVAGHSVGGDIALELAKQRPELVSTLALLEPTILWVPSAKAFLEAAGPSFEHFKNGAKRDAVETFLMLASGFDREKMRKVIDGNVPGCVDSAIADADTFFGIELASLGEWKLENEDLAKMTQPTLSVLGGNSGQVFIEVAEMLRRTMKNVVERRVEGVGHLLHIEKPEPIARVIADFLAHQSVRRAA